MVLQIHSLLLHHVHINEVRVEPEMEHLVLPPSKPHMEELYLDVPTQGDGCGQCQLSIGVCLLDVLVDFRRVDLCLVQTYNEARCYTGKHTSLNNSYNIQEYIQSLQC